MRNGTKTLNPHAALKQIPRIILNTGSIVKPLRVIYTERLRVFDQALSV